MLALLPLGAFVGAFLVLQSHFPRWTWRRAFLRVGVLWGVYAILVTELISLLRAVTPAGLALAWALPLLLSGGWLLRRWQLGEGIALPDLRLPTHWLDRLLLAGVVVVLGVTALVAWLTPPQSWDSLNYHMPRVAHWTQERAVRHFATGREVQNSMSPGAEMIILQFYVVMGGDRLANFVQWFAMAGSLIGVSLIAQQLGAGRPAQLLAAVVAATIPMGIVQASSTMTDYVLAFWAVCVAVETLALIMEGSSTGILLFNGLAAGLALVTKPISVAYITPFAVLAAVILLRRAPQATTLRWGLAAVLLVCALNAGHLYRNYLLYGNPIGSQKRIGLHANQLFTLPGMLSNVLRNAALHTGTPTRAFDEWIYMNMVKAHIKLGVDISDPRTTSVGSYRVIRGITTQEDLVGNLLHSVLILVAFFTTLLDWRRLGTLPVVYALAVTSTFFFFSLLFKWQIFGTRLHTPFFVLYAPSISLVMSGLAHARSGRLVGLAVLIAAIPWLTSINSRPLIPLPNRSSVGSVLVEPRGKLYYANGQGLFPIHTKIVSMIKGQACSTVGIALPGSAAEYPLWVLLGAPDPELEIEWLVGGTPSARYGKPGFRPCAVICQNCPDQWEVIRGLPKVLDEGNFSLFMQR